MKQSYCRRYFKHKKEDELDNLRRSSQYPNDSAIFCNFIRRHRMFKHEIVNKNIGRPYCLSNLWSARDFKGSMTNNLTK